MIRILKMRTKRKEEATQLPTICTDLLPQNFQGLGSTCLGCISILEQGKQVGCSLRQVKTFNRGTQIDSQEVINGLISSLNNGFGYLLFGISQEEIVGGIVRGIVRGIEMDLQSRQQFMGQLWELIQTKIFPREYIRQIQIKQFDNVFEVRFIPVLKDGEITNTFVIRIKVNCSTPLFFYLSKGLQTGKKDTHNEIQSFTFQNGKVQQANIYVEIMKKWGNGTRNKAAIYHKCTGELPEISKAQYTWREALKKNYPYESFLLVPQKQEASFQQLLTCLKNEKVEYFCRKARIGDINPQRKFYYLNHGNLDSKWKIKEISPQYIKEKTHKNCSIKVFNVKKTLQLQELPKKQLFDKFKYQFGKEILCVQDRCWNKKEKKDEIKYFLKFDIEIEAKYMFLLIQQSGVKAKFLYKKASSCMQSVA